VFRRGWVPESPNGSEDACLRREKKEITYEVAMKAHGWRAVFHCCVVSVCIVALLPGDTLAYAYSQSPPPAASGTQSTRIPSDQLDSLVAPVALYPDPLLAQVLAASTYPLEIIQLQQWLGQDQNKALKDKQLADAVAKQPWDPSVQGLAALPDVVKRLADDIAWTTDLGNAFLAQQTDVMDAVQRMRKKAQEKGNLKTTEQQKVETQTVENKQVIVIEQANPQVIYVPSYDPVIVYGPAIYPYPPIYYPPAWYYPAGLAISFGVGMMMGAFWAGGWGWGCGWGGNNVTINNNNNFNRNSNVNRGNRVNNDLPGGGNRGNLGNGNRGDLGGGNRGDLGGGNRGDLGGGNRVNNDLPGGNRGNAGGAGNRPSTLPAGGDRSNWQHNPEHRGGAPYRDRATADRFGGMARGDSLAQRQQGARQQINRQGGSVANNRAGGGGAGVSNRAGGGAGVSNRAAGAGAGNRSLGGGPDSIGSRDLSRSGGGNRDAFGGGSRGYSGSSARNSGSRGMSSMSSRGGGGMSRGGGGGRGGGRR
jgi:Protein of unknown function (DUF3300)